ncbi:MAG: PAS domain S-box protein [Candidatus Cloacimonetes bacterium]|nr:PAS domain S-box protein [Candidatus Cloacimonadota bacterium]
MSEKRASNLKRRRGTSLKKQNSFIAYKIAVFLLVPLFVTYIIFLRAEGSITVLPFIIGLSFIAIISGFTLKLIQTIIELRQREKILQEKEKEYCSLLENYPDIIIRFDKHLRHTFVSPALSRYTNLDPADLIGKTIKDITSQFPGFESELDSWERAIKEVMDTGESKDGVYFFKGETGSYYLQANLIRELDEEGRKYSVLAVIRDVTAQKEIENKLTESEHRARSLLERIPNIAIMGWDRNRRIVFCNDACEDIYGYKKEKIISSKIDDILLLPEQREKFIEAFDRWLKNGKTIPPQETIHKGKKDTSIRVFSYYTKIQNTHDESEFFSIDIDLSKIDEFSDKHGVNNKLLIELSNNIDEIIYVSDIKSHQILFTNKFTQQLIADKAINNKCYQALRESRDPFVIDYSKNFLHDGTTNRWEHYDPDLDCYYLVTEKIISWQNNQKAKFSMILDITPFKKIELDQKLETDKLQSIFEGFGEGVIAMDTEGKITLMNKAAEELTGWKSQDVQGDHIDKVIVLFDEQSNKPSDNSILQVIEPDKISGVTDNPIILTKDGRKRNIYVNSSPILNQKDIIIGDIIVFHDITAKKRKEQELIKSQKLESLGTLAAGIAYDFNNLLSTLFGYIEMAMVFHNSKEKVAQYLSRALGIYERATSLTDKLITFSRRGVPDKKPHYIKDILDETAKFVLSGSKIRYNIEIPEDLWLCDIDKTQIQQVFNNILINSMQAMPDGGVINIKGENIPGSNAPEWTSKTANYVKITVIDEGTGIPESYLDRIFDPFFTTKQQGSGLGLATAYSIIDKHHGSIDVSSVPGEGTTVNVFLPASKSAIHDLDSEEEVAEKYESKILIMDDDPIIIDTVKDALEELGYTVVNCANGSKALLIFEEEYLKGEPFDLVIFDLTVPGELGGLETLKILSEKYPDIVAIATSGYLDNPVMADPQKFGFISKVEKPYNIEDFIESVHSTLKDKK